MKVCLRLLKKHIRVHDPKLTKKFGVKSFRQNLTDFTYLWSSEPNYHQKNFRKKNKPIPIKNYIKNSYLVLIAGMHS